MCGIALPIGSCKALHEFLLGQRLKMSSNGEPLGAGLHCLYTTLHKGYARLSMRLCTVQCYASDVIVELRLCGNDIKGGSVYSMRCRSRLGR